MDTPPQKPRSISGWTLALIGVGLVALWVLALVVLAAAGAPLDNRVRGLFFVPTVGLVLVVVGIVTALRRERVTASDPPRPRYGQLGRDIRAAERRARADRKRARAAARPDG